MNDVERKPRKDETSAKGGGAGAERKPGGSGPGSGSTGAVSPGMGTGETTPRKAPDVPAARPVGERSGWRERRGRTDANP